MKVKSTILPYLLGILSCSFFFAFSFPKNNDQITVSKQVRPLLLEYTSTGCPGCGSWGHPTFNNIAKIYRNDITPVAVHIKYNDPMITEISNRLAGNRLGRKYTPQIVVNRENGVVITDGIDHQESLKKIDQLIRKHKNEKAPYLGGRMNKVGENQIEFEYLVDFSEYEAKETLYISAWLLEDGVMNRQVGAKEKKVLHHHVIRDALDGPFGRQIDPTRLDEQQQVAFNGLFEIKKNRVNLELTSVVLVIWEKKEDGYYPINSLNLAGQK